MPRPAPERLDGRLGRCDQLRTWAGARRLELDDVPDDLGLLNQARARPVAPLRSGRGNQAGPFPGAMIIATVPGPRAGERMRRGEDS